MKVFMSWSGQRSKLTAELLYGWLRCVVQAAQPWISSKGIERGALWFSEINNELKDTSVGIICITQENKNAPWILFESGALAKGLANNRVCTFLVDLESKDLQPPLAQFNHTFPTKDSMWSLVVTLNNSLETGRLEPEILNRVFETYWPEFETDFADIIANNPANTVVVPRDEKDILAEILETTRSIAGRVSTLEERATSPAPIATGRRSLTTLREMNVASSEIPTLKFSEILNLANMYLSQGFSKDEIHQKLVTEHGVRSKNAREVFFFLRDSGLKPPSGD